MTSDGPTLPDYLRPGLDVVFVGINPGAYSASVGRYYATPQNRFWRALTASGLADVGRDLAPGDEALLFAEHRIGFTDVVKRASSSASVLRAADFRRWAPQTRDKLLAASPLIVCFGGLTAYKWFRQYADPGDGEEWKRAQLGEQTRLLGASRVFVAPNPSPANASYSLDDIAGWLRRLAELRARVAGERPS